MNYTILFLTDDRVVRSTSWDNGLDAAKKYARGQMAIEAVHRVEIWDEADFVVFRCSASGQPTMQIPPMPMH
jgi:hypothetical protein